MAKAELSAGAEQQTDAGLQPEDSFGYMVNYVARLYARAMGREMARHGAQMGYFPVLLALWRADGQTQSQLAARAQIEQPTMAATLTRMERDGLIRRAPDASDKRAFRILLTDRAKKLQAPLTDAAREINARSVAALTRVAPEDFLLALHEVAASLSDGEERESRRKLGAEGAQEAKS